jgi:hypothetical protein
VVEQFLFWILHEFGHAIFEMYQVPLFGREEDAADQLAGYITPQFTEDQAPVDRRRLSCGCDPGPRRRAQACRFPPRGTDSLADTAPGTLHSSTTSPISPFSRLLIYVKIALRVDAIINK